jgi:hypothetical protein
MPTVAAALESPNGSEWQPSPLDSSDGIIGVGPCLPAGLSARQ